MTHTKHVLTTDQRKSTLARAHGLYWLVSGLWPILHITSFEAITGPKVDRWLVKTVGTLISVVGSGLIKGSRQDRVAPDLKTIAVGSALSLTAIDLIYVSRRRIRPVYLLDAVAHTAREVPWWRTRLESHMESG